MSKEQQQKTSRHNAIAQCAACTEYILSTGGGRFLYCPCGASFIDQERWYALYVRTGGQAIFKEQICPGECDQDHTDNRVIHTMTELRKYLLDTYNIVLPVD